MRKYLNYMKTMAALLVAAAATTACTNDDNMTNEPNSTADTPKTYTLTVEATMGDDEATRALSLSNNGNTLNATWTEDDEVIVTVQGEEATSGAVGSESVINFLKPTNISPNGRSCTLTGNLNTAVTVGKTLDLMIKRKFTGYSKQDGALATIAENCDHATSSVTVESVEEVKDGDKTTYRVTTMPAKFINQQAIVRFSLTDPYGMPFSPTNLTVTVGSTVKAKLTDIPASTYTTNGEGVLYVAIPNVSSNTVSLIASSPTEVYYYEKESVSFKKGKFYSITVKMAEGNVDLSSLSEDYTAKDGDVLYGDMPQNLKLSIAKNAKVYLHNASTNHISERLPGIYCKGNATIIIMGSNIFKGFKNYAGIFVPSGSTLTIQGGGSLEARGGIYAAGIGGNYKTNCGNIIIDGGKITAYGGKDAAGIGAGLDSNCGNITITGGIITATGGEHGAGIGSGLNGTCGNITITGGSGTAMKGTNAECSIGRGQGGNCGKVEVGKKPYNSGITDSSFTWSL